MSSASAAGETEIRGEDEEEEEEVDIAEAAARAEAARKRLREREDWKRIQLIVDHTVAGIEDGSLTAFQVSSVYRKTGVPVDAPDVSTGSMSSVARPPPLLAPRSSLGKMSHVLLRCRERATTL